MAAVDGSADEAVLAATGAFTARQVHAALELEPDDRVFEIGCGVGRIGAQLAGHVALWHGIDIAENMAALARARVDAHPGATASAVDGPNLRPFATASMDKGYCVAVFIHMDKEDMVLYLREVARVLRPGGLFYFDHWNLSHPVGWQRFAYEVDQVGRSDPALRKDVARNQFCTPEELRLHAAPRGWSWCSSMANRRGCRWWRASRNTHCPSSRPRQRPSMPRASRRGPPWWLRASMPHAATSASRRAGYSASLKVAKC